MMEALRSSAGSWIAKIFIALLALSFGIWGIADVFRGGTSDVLASVGDKKITGEEYRRAFDRQVRVFSQQQGVQITPDQARAIGLDRQVLAQLLQEASLDAQAAKLGLAISDAMIAERIASNKAFQGPNGQFDANRFRQILASNGLSEGEVVNLEKESLLSGGIVDALTSGTEIPKTMAQIAWRHRNEQRDVKYFVIAGDKIVIPPPSDSDLKAYLRQAPAGLLGPGAPNGGDADCDATGGGAVDHAQRRRSSQSSSRAGRTSMPFPRRGGSSASRSPRSRRRSKPVRGSCRARPSRRSAASAASPRKTWCSTR